MNAIIFILLLMNPLLSDPPPLNQQLFDQYEQFKEPTITHRRFKHKDIQPLVKQLKTDQQFTVKKLGESIEGRDINLVSIGSGKTQVLLWSQMHGDEPTATMALMDIFNLFKQNKKFAPLQKLLKSELTLHFIPLLNPDGAEIYQRRNALGIDLNRDALRLQSPEAQILKRVRDSLDADWGFNLHDQSRYYAAGIAPHTASISFLAPAYNYKKDINDGRAASMQLICQMNEVLQKYIPNKVARYSDDFEPRAFGDNIQKWGTSTILIESGGLKNDREKQMLRQLHFVSLITAFEAIAKKTYQKIDIEAYEKIPYNKSNAFSDFILRKVNIEKNGGLYATDIAFRNHEIDYDNHSKFYFQSSIRDIGDLSTSYGYKEFDASDFVIEPGIIYPKKLTDITQLKELDIIQLLAQGYTNFIMDQLPPSQVADQVPFRVSLPEKPIPNQVDIGSNPSLVLKKEGKIKMVIVNGFLYDLEKDKASIFLSLKGLLN